VADLRIPRIVHHVWLGTEPVPAEVRRARTSWRINRRWEQRIWTDANLPGGLLREETAEALRSPRERGAFLRLELLHRFGGVAVEPEMVCSQPLDRFLVGAELAIGEPRQADAGAGLLAAVPGHPVVERALRGLPAVEHWGADPASAEALLAETAARAGIAPAVVPATAAAQPSPSDGDDARDVALAAEAALATTQTELDRLRRETEDARSRFARVRGELLVRGRARTRTHESA
jgi:hypothetical protein